MIKKAAISFSMFFLVIAMCGCGDNISVTNEEPETQETISADSIDEFVDCILAGARDKFASEGVKTGDNEIYVTNDYLRYAYFLDELPEVTSTNYHETFFCCTDEGIKLVSGTFEIKRKDDQILIIDSQYRSISDSINQLKNGELENHDGRLFDDYDIYFLRQSFERIKNLQNDNEAATLEAIMKEAGLKEDMPIISLLYSRDGEEDYSNPVTTVDRLLPELKECSKKTFAWNAKNVLVFVDLGNDQELLINTPVMGKASDGTALYGISNEGYYSEEIAESKKKLYGATITDLENSKDVTYTNIFNDDTDSDYFFIKGIEGKDAQLFGLTNYGGFIIKDGNNIYPVDLYVDNNPPGFFVKSDFDKDGFDEYGFNTCVGRGTGYWVEALVIVDPGENDMVKVFDMDDLQIYNGDLFSHIKSEVDENDHSISYWLETDGKKKYEGTTYLSDYFTDTFKPVKYGFGNQLSIEYSKGSWHFQAGGGIIWKEEIKENGKEFWHERLEPSYEWPLNLNGDIQYKDGKLSYTNLELIPGIEYH